MRHRRLRFVLALTLVVGAAAHGRGEPAPRAPASAPAPASPAPPPPAPSKPAPAPSRPAPTEPPAPAPLTPAPSRPEPPAPAWANDFTARLAAMAVLQTLNAELLAASSATLTLDHWCDVHRLASPARIVAVRDPAVNKPAGAEQRRALAVGPDEPVRYRRVRLMCGARVLSEADNWYVPGRLTADINHQLDTSDIAFGRAAQPLHFQRRTLSARLLWSPLPDGWDVQPAALPDAGARTLTIPRGVLEHRAVLVLPDGTPISTVIETYTAQVLGFPQPRPPT